MLVCPVRFAYNCIKTGCINIALIKDRNEDVSKQHLWYLRVLITAFCMYKRGKKITMNHNENQTFSVH